MLLLPMLAPEPGYMNVVVVLDEEGLMRVRQHDPGELDLRKLPAEWQGLKIKTVSIAYEDRLGQQKVLELMRAGKLREAMQHLFRGFKVQPGDDDAPYLNIGRKPS